MKGLDRILRGGLYRSRNGAILGVCRGIAEYFDFSLFWVRAITVILFVFSGIWPIMILYFLAALLMKPEPVIPIASNDEQEFYDSYVSSRKGAADRLKRRYKNIERRIQRMEHIVTTPEFDWDQKLNR
ncbi:envelope stress response membrane protein PspC [Thermodesulfobacteriota bacterium]